MNKFIALISFLVITLGGCITTGDDKPQKWNKAERSELHTQMGINYYEKGQIDVARDEFQLALDIDQNSARANLAMGHLQNRLGDIKKARLHFSRAVKNDSDNISAMNDYGFFLCKTGETEAGLIQLNKSLNHPLNQVQHFTLYGMGECNRLAGNTVAATENYEFAIRLQPTMRRALFELAKLKFEAMEYFKTRGYLERFFQNRYFTEESLFLAVKNEIELQRRDIAGDYAKQLRESFPLSEFIAQLRPLFSSES